MKFAKLLTIFILAAGFLFIIESCQRVHGCTDPVATNYNPNAQVDNGTCQYVRGCTDPAATNYNPNAKVDNGTCTYSGVATFYFDQNGPNATVHVNGQTGTITANYQTGAPTCGISATGCANFTLPVGTYSYTASSTLSSWTGTVTVNANSCALVSLQQSTGDVIFWTASNTFGNITLSINGGSKVITSYITGGTPTCGFTGCATFDLAPGVYNYSATSTSGSTWNGTVTITADGCQPIQLT